MSPPPSPRTTPPATATALAGDVALVFRARDRLCALPVAHVTETMRPLPVDHLAGMPSFVMGVSLIRGVPTPVVDAGALLGESTDRVSARLVVIRAGERRVALAVEEVLGVRALSGVTLQELPPLLGEPSGLTVAAVGTLDAELLVVLRAARVVPESTWMALASNGVPT